MLEQLRRLGAPPEVLRATQERLAAEAASATVPVWPENWHAVIVFIGMATQWNWVAPWRGQPQRTGLRLEALPVVRAATLRNVPRRLRVGEAELLDQLQQMEDAALDEMRHQQ